MLLADVLCRARVLLWQMVKRGELLEPTTAAHLAMLELKARVGSKMSKDACKDPAKAKYIGQCCGGTRVWGEGYAAVYMDECGSCPRLACPLPLDSFDVSSPLSVSHHCLTCTLYSCLPTGTAMTLPFSCAGAVRTRCRFGRSRSRLRRLRKRS